MLVSTVVSKLYSSVQKLQINKRKTSHFLKTGAY